MYIDQAILIRRDLVWWEAQMRIQRSSYFHNTTVDIHIQPFWFIYSDYNVNFQAQDWAKVTWYVRISIDAV